MKKLFTLAAIVSLTYCTQAQVGIGTLHPQANLDVNEANPDSPTGFAGIAIPRVNNLPSSGNVAGQILYLTSASSYYFFNGVSWRPLSSQTNIIGDVKSGFQNTDHNGWIRLDGRPLADLTQTQQTAAKNLLGQSTIYLPDASDKFLIGRNASSEASIGSTIGSNTAQITIQQTNLPNITMSATTSSSGSHSHDLASQPVKPVSGSTLNVLLEDNGGNPINMYTTMSKTTTLSGSHTHTVDVNTGGNGTPLPISVVPSSIVTNTFIYLGN